jgi:hypothetical protein
MSILVSSWTLHIFRVLLATPTLEFCPSLWWPYLNSLSQFLCVFQCEHHCSIFISFPRSLWYLYFRLRNCRHQQWRVGVETDGMCTPCRRRTGVARLGYSSPLSSRRPATPAINHTNLSTAQSLGAIVATAIHHVCNHPTSCHRINLFMVSLTAISGPVLQFPSRCSQVCVHPKLSTSHACYCCVLAVTLRLDAVLVFKSTLLVVCRTLFMLFSTSSLRCGYQHMWEKLSIKDSEDGGDIFLRNNIQTARLRGASTQKNKTYISTYMKTTVTCIIRMLYVEGIVYPGSVQTAVLVCWLSVLRKFKLK